MTVNQPDLKYCTQDPRCQGPRLIDNHTQHCPFEGGEDCDNDQCGIMAQTPQAPAFGGAI